MRSAKFFRFLFSFCIIFHFSIIGILAQDNSKEIIENQLFPSFLLDQFIEEKLSILSKKPSDGLNEHFINSINKFKTKGFKKLFTDYVSHKFSLEEIQKLNSFYQARRDFYQKQLSPEIQKKFSELITDLSFLLANVPDNEETGVNSVSFKNEVSTKINDVASSGLATSNSNASSTKAIGSSTIEQQVKRFNLGEFVATSRDEELHYIKVEIEFGYLGQDEEILVKNKGELRDAVTSVLMKMTVQRAKEDYIDQFLHRDLEKKIQEILDQKAPGKIKIIKVFIPVFLIN